MFVSVRCKLNGISFLKGRPLRVDGIIELIFWFAVLLDAVCGKLEKVSVNAKKIFYSAIILRHSSKLFRPSASSRVNTLYVLNGYFTQCV